MKDSDEGRGETNSPLQPKTEEEAVAAGVTRREWLWSLGSAVVLSGFRGGIGELAEAQVAKIRQGAATKLPPGLYAPSLDHLTHVLRSDSTFVAIPPGAETEYVRSRSGPFVPEAFSREEFALVRRLVEIILGEDLKESREEMMKGAPESIYDEVAEWIDLLIANASNVRRLAQSLPADQRALAVAYFGSEAPVRELETFEPELVCRDGMKWLEEESQRRFAKRFVDTEADAQVELVRSISDVRQDKSSVHAGTRLFDFVKAECIRGFYTSRLGLKELDYKGNAFYAESPGCGLTVALQGKLKARAKASKLQRRLYTRP